MAQVVQAPVLVLALFSGLGLIVAGCGQAAIEKSNAETRAEIARLTEENRMLPELRKVNEEVIRLSKENESLPALRNQYRRLQEVQKENEQLQARLNQANPPGGPPQ